MGKAFKALVTLMVFTVIVLTIYGYTVDMAPSPRPISQNVVLNGG